MAQFIIDNKMALEMKQAAFNIRLTLIACLISANIAGGLYLYFNGGWNCG